MRILDRYILRQFATNFVILLFVLMALVTMVDLMFNLDEFIEGGRYRAEISGDSGGSGGGGNATWWTIRLIIDYYVPLLLFLFIYLAGLLVVAAAGFTLIGLARSGELVTIISSGVSMHRIALPLVAAACFINGLTLVNQELIIPQMADKLTRKTSDFKTSMRKTYTVFYAKDSRGALISAAQFDPVDQRLTGLTILERDKAGRTVARISADDATWDDGKKQWRLSNGRVMRRTAGGEGGTLTGEEKTEPLAAYATDMAPNVLMARRAAIYPTLLAMSELSRMMENPAADTRAVLRIMHSRFSLMVLNVLVFAMTLPVFLTREPANPISQAVKSAGIGIGSWMTGIGVLQLTSGELNPVVAAWLPVVLFLPVAAWLLQRVKT